MTCCAGVPVEVHEGTAAKMRQHYDARGLELNAARLRMATLPATAEVEPHVPDATHNNWSKW